MEVHHHSSPAPGGAHTPRKKWTHYFWEFLMLFLAVFCGFLAEYQLEHMIEKEREKVYIKSMVEDLTLDTTEFISDNKIRREAIVMFDSLILLLKQKTRNEFQQQRMYYFARMGLRMSPFPTLNDRTYEQMKSSGNLRLISHQETADRITNYYFRSKEFSVNSEQSMLRLQSLIECQGKIFDGVIFQEMTNIGDFTISPPSGNPSLITEDKKIVNDLIVRIHYVLSILLYTEKFVARMKNEASQLIEILQKEYDLN
jgi:hypothetical protein